jgi:hypothetical protein
MKDRLPYVWDYEIDTETFLEILAGKRSVGRLNQDWAARRMLEYAPYEDIIHQIGYRRLIENWPHWRTKNRSQSWLRGFDFLVSWLPKKHPELCNG